MTSLTAETDAEQPMLSRVMPKFGKTYRQYAAAISASLGAFCAGTVLAWSSPGLELVVQDASKNVTNTTDFSLPGFTISPDSQTLVASILTVGALVSALPTGYLADKFGRKPVILTLSCIFLLCWLLISQACSLGMLLAGRFFAGIALGGVCVTSSMYVIEISEPRRRGTLGSFFNLFLNFGVLFINVLGCFDNWLSLSIPPACMAVTFGVSFYFFPESPIYLMEQHRIQEAKENLTYFRSSKHDVTAELDMIQKEIQDSYAKTATMKDIVTNKGYLRAVTCAVGIMAFQQLSGINAIIFYAVSIFKAAGSTLSPSLSAIIMSLVQLIAAYLVTFIIEKANRKFFLTLSSVGMMLALLSLGIFFHLQILKINITGIGFLPIFSAVLFAISFCLGYGPISYMIIHELLAPEIRGIASGFAVVVNWSMAFLVTHFYPIMSQNVGPHVTYYIFAGIMIIATIFVFFVVPETRGKSMSEIIAILNR